MTKRPRNAAQTRVDILDSARRRFAAEGYDRTTLRAIASDVGVDAAMVTRYFGSKQDLFATATSSPSTSRSDRRGPPTSRTCCCRGTSPCGKKTTRSWRCSGAMRVVVPPPKLNETLAVHVAPTLKAATPDHDQQRIALTLTHRAGRHAVGARQRPGGRPQPRRTAAVGGPGVPATAGGPGAVMT